MPVRIPPQAENTTNNNKVARNPSKNLRHFFRALWLMLEGGLMKFLAKGATEKIVEDADEKREALIKTFQVTFPYFFTIF